MDTKTFIEKSRKIHGDKYDYSKVEYVDYNAKVCIICNKKDKLGKKHGEFYQSASNHLANHGCPKCNGKGFEKSYYIDLAKIVHNNKYDYSKSDFKNVTEKTTIICPIHGEFKQNFNYHINGQGCPECYGNKKMTTEEFIEKAKKVHGNKYDYSKVEYSGNNKSYLTIVCPIHGEFKQKANGHLMGNGCPKCAKKHSHTTSEFIEESRKIHGDKYDYSKVEYVNNHTKVCLICPEHGEFWIKPNSHLSSKQGCPICKYSKLEEIVFDSLPKNMKIIRRYRTNWLGKQELDFYLPEYNVAIECQGIQHFEPIEFWGGKDKLNYIIKLDETKYKKCLKNGVNLIYFSDYKIGEKKYFNKIFNKTDDIIKYINETSNETQNR